MKKLPPLLNSFAFRLLLFLIPVVLFGILFTGFVGYYIAQPYLLKNVKKEIRLRASEKAEEVSKFIFQRKNEIEMISQNPMFLDFYKNRTFELEEEAEAYRSQIEEYLRAFIKRTGVYGGIWYLSEKGRTLIVTKGAGPAFLAGRPEEELFNGLIREDNEEVQLKSVSPRPEDKPWILFSKKTKNPFGEKTGTLIFVIEPESVIRITDSLNYGDKGHAAVDGLEPPPSWSQSPGGAFQNPFSVEVPIEGTPWKISSHVDLDQFLDPLREVRALTIALSLLSAVLVSIFIYFRVRFMIRPIQRLKEAAKILTEGNLSKRVDVKANDEIGDLARTFNAMAQALETRTVDLEKRVRENTALLENIRISELRYRTVLDSSLDAIIGLNEEFKITTWNNGAGLMFGYSYEEVQGKDLSFLFGASARSLLEEAGENRRIQNYDLQGVTREGRTRDLNLTMAGSSDRAPAQNEWSLVIRDVTHQKALQAQLLQSEKLSVVGQLVAGVAHEINNPLTAVVGYSELLKGEDVIRSGELYEDIDHIYQNAIRCREIVGNLLRFVRKGTLKRKDISVNEILADVIRLMEYRLCKKESVELKWEEDKKLEMIFGDTQQLEQVFLNLFHNACDAMKGMSGKKIIRMETEDKGDVVEIRFIDNGPGIPTEIREKIFQPFFTTKEEGRGTGLGLAISSRIIHDHDGTLEVGSGPEGGTQFTIRVPKARNGGSKQEEGGRDARVVRGKKFLVVDDEVHLTELMEKILSRDGNEVQHAKDAAEAREILIKKKFDLVVCDIELGGVKGTDLYFHMKNEGFHMPEFIFISGDVCDPKLAKKISDLGFKLIAKPFLIEDFKRVIYTSLEK